MKAKIRKNQMVITALAIMIAVAGYINYSGGLVGVTSQKTSAVTSDSVDGNLYDTVGGAASTSGDGTNGTSGDGTNGTSGDGTNGTSGGGTVSMSGDGTGSISGDGTNGTSGRDDLVEPGTAVLTSAGVSSSVIAEAKLNREQVRARNKESLLEIVNNSQLTEKAKQEAVDKITALADNAEKEMAAELLLEAKGFEDCVVSIVDGSCDVVVNRVSLTESEKTQIEDIVKRKSGLSADKVTISLCNN